MAWFKKKPTEETLELIVLQAAMLARANEHDHARLSTTEEILACIGLAAKQTNVHPDAEQTRLAVISIQALLVESQFLEELMRYRLSQPPGAPLPSHFRAKMLAAMQKSVDDFLKNQGKG